jgi:hypothetical protein
MSEEREKIVAWLRSMAADCLTQLEEMRPEYHKDFEASAALAESIASQIERGDHLVWNPRPSIPVKDWIGKPSVGH